MRERIQENLEAEKDYISSIQTTVHLYPINEDDVLN